MSMLAQIFVYLLAAVVAVPLAKRLGLGAVLGYLVAGILVGPFVLGLVGDDPEALAHFAEFGVVMMLFLIGLELEPERLWRLRVAIFGLGAAQVVGTAAAVAGVGIAFGMAWQAATALGLILAMSSTAIVLQVLAERGWNTTQGGQAAFAVLLFQDISVIPILAVLPLLATLPAGGAEPAHGLGALPAWQQFGAILGAVAIIVVGGRYAGRPLLRLVASTEVRELFTAVALLIVVGVALLMQSVGLSPALGAFLGGVVLASSEYRHELEGDIEPFKGLLLGLFFIAVGAGIDFAFIAGDIARVVLLAVGMMALKLAVLVVLGRAFRLETSQALLLAFALAQGGEFAFVLLSLALQQGTLAPDLAQACVAGVALSMLATPPFLGVFARFVLPRFQAPPATRTSDVVDEGAPVLIAGFGRVGSVIGRVLSASGIRSTVLDLDPNQIEALRNVGLKAYYGDASRLDLLIAAGAERAKVLVLAIDDQQKTEEILDLVERHFPHLRVIVRVRGRFEAYALFQRGHDEVYRETLGTAFDMSEATLRSMGFRAYQARRAVQQFRLFDERTARELARHRGDRKTYFATARQRLAEAETLLSRAGIVDRNAEHGWDNAPLRAAAGEPPAATAGERPAVVAGPTSASAARPAGPSHE